MIKILRKWIGKQSQDKEIAKSGSTSANLNSADVAVEPPQPVKHTIKIDPMFQDRDNLLK